MTVSAVFLAANPSVGLIYSVDQFQLGTTNRAGSAPVKWPNGKAVTGASVFKLLGGDPTLVIPVGGPKGQWLRRQLADSGCRANFVPIEGRVRATLTILATSRKKPVQATQLLEPGPELRKTEQERLSQTTIDLCRDKDFCVLAGSLPRGLGRDFYANLMEEIRTSSNCKILLDTSGETLKGSLIARPDIVKINEREFSTVAGKRKALAREPDLATLQATAEEHEIDTLIVTRGAQDTLVWDASEGALRVRVPATEVVNPVGAGDCFVAGYLAKRSEGLLEGLRWGVAAASASTLHLVPGSVHAGEIAEIVAAVQISRLG